MPCSRALLLHVRRAGKPAWPNTASAFGPPPRGLRLTALFSVPSAVLIMFSVPVVSDAAVSTLRYNVAGPLCVTCSPSSSGFYCSNGILVHSVVFSWHSNRVTVSSTPCGLSVLLPMAPFCPVSATSSLHSGRKHLVRFLIH